MIKRINILIVFMISIFSTVHPQTSVYGILEGTVVDSVSKEPLIGVNIIILGTTMGTTSDLQGHFELRKIPTGRYKIKSTIMGYRSQMVDAQILPSQTTSIHFKMKETVLEMPALVVTAGKKAQSFQDVPNSVSLISAREIERRNRTYLNEVLDYTPGVNVIEGDVNIRGSSGFSLGAGSRVLLLVDGIPMMPGDSGDIKWDLIPLSQIERVEIVKGAGSALYGSYALGGVINIITKKANENGTNLHIAFGEHDIFQGDVSLSFPFSSGKNLFSFSRKKSKGYRPNTDFDISTFYYTMSFDFNLGKLDLSASYLDKKFGAYCFYSDQYPNEWESINTFFFNASACFQKGGVTVFPKLHYRKKNDDFILDRERPDWFRNKHKTDDYGFEIQGNVNSKLGASAFGFEVGRDEINSSNLGDHTYQKAGIFWEHRFIHNQKVIIVPGISSYYNSIWGWNYCPGMDFGYQLSEKMKIFGNIGKSFRVPTFTELYYQSPANIGNQNLKPERAWTYEAGLNFSKEHFSAELALFHRNGFNLIDWVRDDPEQLWKAQNITRVATNGGEINVRYFPNFSFICIVTYCT